MALETSQLSVRAAGRPVGRIEELGYGATVIKCTQ
jgi:hypothetical protein